MKMRSQEIISALVYLCVFLVFYSETIILATHTTCTYIYIETHTHDHTFILSAHAPTRVSRDGRKLRCSTWQK